MKVTMIKYFDKKWLVDVFNEKDEIADYKDFTHSVHEFELSGKQITKKAAELLIDYDYFVSLLKENHDLLVGVARLSLYGKVNRRPPNEDTRKLFYSLAEIDATESLIADLRQKVLCEC